MAQRPIAWQVHLHNDFLQLKGGRGKISETFYRIIETKVQNTCLTVVGYIIQTLSKFGWRKETGLLGMVVKSGIFRRIVVRVIHLSSDLKKKGKEIVLEVKN